MKQRWEHTTKSERIEWTVTKDEERKESKAVFYIMDPQYHAHPWTACSVSVTPEQSEISTYAFKLFYQEQTAALMKALNMASRFAAGKKLSGKKRD